MKLPTKTMRIFICIISLFLVSNTLKAQDTLVKKHPEVYGLRIGTDLIKASRNVWDKNYKGFEINTDYRYNKDWYIAAEAGFEDRYKQDDQLTYTTSGMFLKIGVEKNLHKNWLNMHNMIYVGGRYGMSLHNQTLHSYRINTGNGYFNEEIQNPELKSTGLSAHWLELTFGMKIEIVDNLFLGVNARFTGLLFQKQPEAFENLYYPGFGQKHSGSIGAGVGYTISYLIPFKRKYK